MNIHLPIRHAIPIIINIILAPNRNSISEPTFIIIASISFSFRWQVECGLILL